AFAARAALCLQDRNVGRLCELVEAHRRAHPDDVTLPSWALQVRWLSRDYEGALRLLDEHSAGLFARSRYRWQAADFRVRALVRLGRHEEAVRAAEAATKGRGGNRFLLVLAHAAAGDIKQAL